MPNFWRTVIHFMQLTVLSFEVLFCKMCKSVRLKWGHKYTSLTSFLFFLTGMTNAEVLHQVEHGYRMQIPQGCPRALYDIMLECWHKDPLKRPTFETLQWKLEDFFTMSDSEYRDATAYWCEKKNWRKHVHLSFLTIWHCYDNRLKNRSFLMKYMDQK